MKLIIQDAFFFQHIHLRDDLHIMKFIHFKCTIWWVSVNWCSCAAFTTILFRARPSTKRFPYACFHLIPVPTVNPKGELICLLPLFLTFLEISYKIKSCVWLLSSSIILLRFINVVAYICGLVLLHCWIIFHHVDILPFVYLLTSWSTCKLFIIWGNCDVCVDVILSFL